MLTRRLVGGTAVLSLTSCLALGAACNTQKPEGDQDSGVPDASSDTVVTSGPIWTDDSRVVDVGCFGFFQGSKRIRATRDQLSADQLTILSGLRLTPPQSTCATDTFSCNVAITAADGTVATYYTDQLDSDCGGTKPLIPFASFNPFLRSFPCTSAKQTMGLSPDGGETLLSILPDPRCYNGLFAAPSPVQRLLVVDDPSIPRHVELDWCNDTRRSPATAHPQLLTPDGTTPLPVVWVAVTTDPGPDSTCYRADYTFPAAGAYVLSIDLDAGFTAGDFFVRFY